MIISQASGNDAEQLARLLWLDTCRDEPTAPSLGVFADDLAQWWADRSESHVAFIARLPHSELVGMAWVALVQRVPRPGAIRRFSADIQSVYVVPEQRGRGIGSALVDAASEHAARLGAQRVTVHSGRRAVPVYQRLGFASSPQLLQRPPDANTAPDP